MATRVETRRVAAGKERIFFTTMAAAMLAICLWGFASTFYLRMIAPPAIPSYLDPPGTGMRALFVVHGLVFTGWMALLMVQSSLVGAGNLRLHRAIGEKAYILYGLMLATAIPVATYGAIHGYHVPGIDRHAFSALPFLAIAVFAVLGWMGLAERRDVGRHKRLMLLASAIILGAASGRIMPLKPYIAPPLDIVLLVPLALVVWDFATLGRIHRTTLRAGTVVVLVQVFAIPIGMTAPWTAMATAVFG